MNIVMIDISTACGAKCKYCLHQYRNMAVPKFMPFENFTKIIRILSNEGYDYIFPYLSGEPIIHPQYWDMIALMSEYKMTSNTASKLCYKIDMNRAANVFSKNRYPIHFDITIDAHNQETQDKIAKNINNSMVYENLSALAKISSKNKLVSISVVTVVNSYNEEYLNKIKRMVIGCGVSKWTPKPMGYYMGYNIMPEDEKMISEMSSQKNRRFSIVNGKIVSKMKSCDKFLKPVIGVNGEVTICCHDMLYNVNTGNVLKTGSLKEIINSSVYQNARKLGSQMLLPICKGCN